MNLISSGNSEVEKIVKKIMLMLTDRETNWDDQQKIKLKLQFKKKNPKWQKNK